LFRLLPVSKQIALTTVESVERQKKNPNPLRCQEGWMAEVDEQVTLRDALRVALRRLKAGDIEGLAVLVGAYQVEAARVAYLITRDKSLADDVTQESFLRVYRHIQNYDDARPFAPYLMRIVANTAVEAVKRRQRDNRREVDVELSEDALTETLPHPEALLESAELQQAIWEALESLSPEQRAVVVLRYYADYSEREIADALKIPSGTVSWRLHNARRQLRAALHRFGNNSSADSAEHAAPSRQPSQQSKQEG
jgi:RNA polymerase sigma-70 factor (ECF subfamily)